MHNSYTSILLHNIITLKCKPLSGNASVIPSDTPYRAFSCSYIAACHVAVTKQDIHPLPHTHDILHFLAWLQYFTTHNLASRYWQVKLILYKGFLMWCQAIYMLPPAFNIYAVLSALLTPSAWSIWMIYILAVGCTFEERNYFLIFFTAWERQNYVSKYHWKCNITPRNNADPNIIEVVPNIYMYFQNLEFAKCPHTLNNNVITYYCKDGEI